ncbi:MAG: DNA repair protein RecO [Clostridiales bacterium]|nr:DNA repair protein RecO [Clostridiales bacterium]
MTFNTDAIVLKIVKTGESDRLITFLTRDRGVLKAFAKAAGRPKNKLHMSTNLFCYGHFTFYEGTKALQVRECELSETFFNLQNDISRLAAAQYFNELIIETAPVSGNAEEYMRLLLNSLYFLAQGKRDTRILKSVFELRLVSIIGYMPSLVACAECGKFESDPMYFNESTGELFCNECRKIGSTEYPLEVISAMRHIVYSDLNRLFTLKVSEANISKLNFATEKYLISKVQKNFNSLEFYKSL